MNKLDRLKTLEAVHTHTHTHTLGFLRNNGAKEEVESTRRVAILPRDCE